jgi:hypothetical protein
VFPVPGQGPGVLACVLAYLVEADFGGFPVQDAVAAADAFPGADGAQFRRGDGGLDAQAVQVLEVVVGHVPGVAATRGVGGGLDLKVVGGPGEHALLAVEGVLGPHADEAGTLQVLVVVCGLAHRLRPWR